jgi:hypothetical protein
MIRWVPANVQTWKTGNNSGYIIERFLQTDFPNGNSTQLSSSPILPLSRIDTTWNKLIRENKLNALVLESLSEEKNKTTDPEKIKTEAQLKFGFVLKACDLSIETAKAEGLFFCDKTISSGQAYVYRIRLATIPQGINHTPGISILSDKFSVLKSPEQIRGEFKNKKVAITFNVESTREEYAGYIIERSEDSLHFSRINSSLLSYAKSQYELTKTELIYQDTFPENHKTYWYRVRGYSYFGLTGPPSATVKGKGREEWNAFPIMDTIYSPDNKSVLMNWKMNLVDSSQLKSFIIMRAPKVDGHYEKINSVAINNFSFTDQHPSFTNYYLVGAISIYNDTGFSFPYLMQLQDNDPPPVPQNVKGVIDTNGIVHLSWQNVSANDLKGYRIFRCNNLKEEFYEVSDSILTTTFFTDTITLQTLTRTIYYCVRSVDKMYNNSKNSSPCLLKRPDKIPPVSPVVKFIVHSDSTIQLDWINSSSDDVRRVELFRKSSTGEISQISSWTGKDTIQHFTDFSIHPGTDYSYSILVTDSSGNKSLTDFPTIHFQPRIYPALKNISAIPDFEKRNITLSWEAPNEKVDRYIIYKAKKGEQLRTWKTVDGNSSSVIDKELYVGNTYIYKVKAVLKNGAETKMVELEVVY